MQEYRYDELEARASISATIDEIKQLEARTRVKDVITQMRESGEALTLSEEEENLLWAFRRFKLRMKKQGEVFKWQTRLPEGVQLVSETALIELPEETPVEAMIY